MRFNARNITIMDDDNIIINDVPNPLTDGTFDSTLDEDETADLPKSLIITNLDVTVFDNEDEKLNFESLFTNYGEVSFQYFKSFRRVRVNFSSPHVAASARIELHQARVCDKTINCYFAQSISPKDDGKDPYLQPPSPVKQYLISPPASPPVGWEPVGEAQPMVNYDLLSALADMEPGESRELHPPSGSQPGIVVHPCEQDPDAAGPKPVIQHTPCPERC